jgi:hypothetical protein
MAALDLDRLAEAPLVRDPFDHVIVPGLVRADALGDLARDFPPIHRPGSFPVEELRFGPAFAAMLAELTGPAFARALGAKLEVDLAPFPTLVTVRGRARARDGRVHTDSADKVVTALLYLNGPWRAEGGRLRLLRDARDLDRPAAEVPPEDGTLVAFLRSERSFHGHRAYVGPRRVIQVNWVRTGRIAARERLRHRLAARLKSLAGRPARA